MEKKIEKGKLICFKIMIFGRPSGCSRGEESGEGGKEGGGGGGERERERERERDKIQFFISEGNR